MKAIKKWEVRTGPNRGYYVAVKPSQATKFYPIWGSLNNEYWSTVCIKRRHSLPQDCVILTHSIWARGVMRKEWEKVTTN